MYEENVFICRKQPTFFLQSANKDYAYGAQIETNDSLPVHSMLLELLYVAMAGLYDKVFSIIFWFLFL